MTEQVVKDASGRMIGVIDAVSGGIVYELKDKSTPPNTYKAVRWDAWNLTPSVVDVGFRVKGGWLYVVQGGVTGYESVEWKPLIRTYVDRMGAMEIWTAYVGTFRKYDRLEIPVNAVLEFLKSEGLVVEAVTEYGYLMGVKFSDGEHYGNTKEEVEERMRSEY